MPSSVFTTFTSSRNTFKRCELLWLYSAKEALALEPDRPQRPLWFGTGVHVALAAYYDPATPREIDVLLTAWDHWVKAERDRFVVDYPRLAEDEEWQAEIVEDEKLGREVLAHYATWAPTVDDFEVIWVERQYVLPLGRSHRETLRYGLKPDGLVRDANGLYWILEHKTASTIPDTEDWLTKDEQCGSYILGIERAEKINIEGVLYNTLRKKSPKPLRELQNGAYSTDVRQDTTLPIAAKALIDRYGSAEEIPGRYHPLLEKLRQGNTFFKRLPVRRNRQELTRLGSTILLESREMLRKLKNPQTITRTPTQFNCSGCAFALPCTFRFEGNADAEAALLTSYRKKEL